MPPLRRRIARVTAAAAVPVLALGLAVPAEATPAGPLARPDTYLALRNRPLNIPAVIGLLGNDKLAPRAGAVVNSTSAQHGTVQIKADGSFVYTPAPGFHGIDSFTYTATDAATVYPTSLPPLATIDGVQIKGGAFGSAVTPVPGAPDEYYGLTDRGPNVDGPNGTKVEPLPSFTPAIGRFRMVSDVLGTRAVLLKTIPLLAADGTPYNGQVNTQANTGETILGLDGNPLSASPNGYDPEGIVALPDGTFWISDEYGPFITHFDRTGKQIGRLSPYDGTLPRELINRVPNKGMEGLTITPDGRTLVGIMQNSLQAPDVTEKTGAYPLIRIVTVDIKTGAQHEYAYLLDNPGTTASGVSEITALSATQFLVDERDGRFEPGAYKKLWRIDVSGATDIGPANPAYSATGGGVLVGGSTLEELVGKVTTTTAQATLAVNHIQPVSKTIGVDLGGVVTALNPSGYFFGHDKMEGVATTDHGRTLLISNDNDFGISGLANTAPPFQLAAKKLPNGTQDDGEYLALDTTKLVGGLAQTSTANVTVLVL